MASTLLLELVLRARSSEPALASTALQLLGAYAVELDDRGRRLGSQRLAVLGAPAEGDVRRFEDEASLLREVAALLARSECLVTAQGRQIDLPVLETLAMRHAVTLPGQFSAEDPYRSRHSSYNVACHLDLCHFLADGDRRLRSLTPQLLVPFVIPGAARPPARDFQSDTLAAARLRAFATYLLFLRVQRLRGFLSGEDLRARLAELGSTAPDPELREQAARASWTEELGVPPATRLEAAPPGVLAFDIETVLDLEGLARCLGHPVPDAAAGAAGLAELLGTPTEFAPAPLHKVVAVALCHWDPVSGAVEVERLRLGGRTGVGAPLPTELELLAAFWRAAVGQRLLSYNGKRFDLPVLLYRSLPWPIEVGWFLAEKRPPFEQYRHPQSRRQLDLFDQLGGGLSPGKLGDLLQAAGLPGKLGPHGADVQALWTQGDAEAVGDYCLQDSAQTLLLGLRFLTVSGELSPEDAKRAAQTARERFSREAALQAMVNQAGEYFATAAR